MQHTLNKIYKTLLLLIVLSNAINIAFADERYKFINPICSPELEYFEISPKHIMNIGDYHTDKNKSLLLTQKYNLYPEGEGSISCNIGHKVVINYKSTKPHATGACAIGTKSSINILIDDKLVAENIIFDADCFSAGTTAIAIQNNYDFISIAFSMHAYYSDYGPKPIINDSALVFLKKNEYLFQSKEKLPITMNSLEKRIEKLTH